MYMSPRGEGKLACVQNHLIRTGGASLCCGISRYRVSRLFFCNASLIWARAHHLLLFLATGLLHGGFGAECEPEAGL